VSLGKIEGGHKNQNREKIPKSVTFGGGVAYWFQYFGKTHAEKSKKILTEPNA